MPGSMQDKRRRKERLTEAVIASEAKQSIAPQKRMDCFVAYAPRNDEADITSRYSNTHAKRLEEHT
jgi:hypothetical protein